MNTDADQLLKKRKMTGSITCLVAAVLMLVSLFLPWLKSAKGRGSAEVGMSLLSIKACGDDRDFETDKVTHKCESMSNLELVRTMKKQYAELEKLRAEFPNDDGSPRAMPDKPGTSFAYFGIATLILSVIGVLALGAAGGLGLKDKFIRDPIAITTIALLALCLALVLGCIFVAVKPGDSGEARALGVSWPFFIFGIGVVGGIAGAQLLGKAFGPPEYDPYADPTATS